MSMLRVALFQCHPYYATVSRSVVFDSTLKARPRVFHVPKQKVLTGPKQIAIKECHAPKSLSRILKFGFGGLGIIASCVLKSTIKTASCEKINIIKHTNRDQDKLIFKWREFLKYLHPHLWHLLIALTSALVVAVLNSWIPQCVGSVINVLTKVCQEKKPAASNLQQLIEPAFTLAKMYIAQAFFTFVYIYTLAHVGEKVASNLRQDLFKSIIMQDIAFFDKNRTGEIISRLTSDIQEFKSTFKTCIAQGLRSCTQILGCVISVIMLSPRLTGLMVLCVPTVIFIGTLLGRSLRQMSNEAQHQVAKSTAVCEEVIQNIRTVRAFAAEDKEIKHFSNEVESAANLYERLGFGIGLFQAGTNLFLNSVLLSTLYCGGHLLSTGQLTPGDLMAFLMATQTVQRSLSQLSVLFGTYIRGISAGARVFEFLDMQPSPMMVGGKTTDMSLAGNIVFDGVKFSYPSRPDHVILKNFNLNIPSGKTVAIVGSSGNGKSTVAALLERFYDVTEGCILIDGLDIRSYNSSYLRGNVLGYIDQEPILFATSIMENIRYSKQGATDQEVIAAAKEANAHEFIINFPNGYSTEVGERGAQLSGGQKQRVAIARALLKQPSILILDEATSALDYESERIVQKALEGATKGRTVLVIAHRLSTVKNADIIVVLQKGVIVEMGTHTELLKKKGAYYTLVNEQEGESS